MLRNYDKISGHVLVHIIFRLVTKQFNGITIKTTDI